MAGFGVLNDFISGAIWLAAVIALGFTGLRAVRTGHFQAVSESYYGRKAQNFGAACLVVGAIVALLFLLQIFRQIEAVVFFGQFVSPLFFFAGAAVGGYFTYRYYAR